MKDSQYYFELYYSLSEMGYNKSAQKAFDYYVLTLWEEIQCKLKNT